MNFAIKYKLEQIIKQNYVIKKSDDNIDVYQVTRPVNEKSAVHTLLFTVVNNRFCGEYYITTNDNQNVASGDLLEINQDLQDIFSIIQSCEDKYQKQIRERAESVLRQNARNAAQKAIAQMNEREKAINAKLNSILGNRQY